MKNSGHASAFEFLGENMFLIKKFYCEAIKVGQDGECGIKALNTGDKGGFMAGWVGIRIVLD